LESKAGAIIEEDRERISQRCIELAGLFQSNGS